MSAETEKYNQAWKKFQEAMSSLRQKRSEILNLISKKLDQRRIEIIRKKIKGGA